MACVGRFRSSPEAVYFCKFLGMKRKVVKKAKVLKSQFLYPVNQSKAMKILFVIALAFTSLPAVSNDCPVCQHKPEPLSFEQMKTLHGNPIS